MCYVSTMKMTIADDLSTHSDDIKMAECAAYAGIHHTQQKPSNDTGVYEQISTTT